MSSSVSWGKLAEQNQKSSGKVNNLKLEVGTYTVRFVGEPIEFHKYFVAGKSAVTVADWKNSCPVHKKHGIEPGTRYAINVIDRADKQLKVLECSITVLKNVINWGKLKKRDPGSINAEAIDFIIESTGSGKNRRYSTLPDEPSLLTEEEKKMIKAVGGTDAGYDLQKLYKSVPLDEIENRLFGTGNSVPTNNSSKSFNQQNVGQKVDIKEEDIPF